MRIPFRINPLIAPLPALLLASAIFFPSPALSQPSAVTGQTISLGTNGERFAVPGAKLTLSSVSEAAPETAPEKAAPPPLPTAESDEQGLFRFPKVPEGCYIMTAETPGLRGQSDIFCVPLSEDRQVILELGPKVFVESVDVTATAIGIDPTQTSSTGSVGVSTLYDAPKINKRYDDVMPFIPGVFKGPAGEMTLNGARPTQSGAQFNGVNITDPVIGSSPFSVPLDTVSNVQVLSNPYDAQYGGFAGAVSTVETKPADMSDFKVALQDFVPRMRRRDGSIVGIEAIAPRFTLTGPIRKGKLAFLHSTEYHFIRLPQDDANLPPLERDTERETLTVFNQLDVRHTDRNSSTFGLLIFPAKVNFFGLDAFTQQASTPDLRRRGYLLAYRNRHDFRAGAILLSTFSYEDLEKDVKPRGHDPYIRSLDQTSGSFFNREARASKRWQWSEQYSFAPLTYLGDHQLRAGFDLAHESFRGSQTFNPITWLGAGNLPIRRAEFDPTASLRANKQDYAGFLQNKWILSPALTLDLGFRLERDTIASRTNPSFRTGFAYSIGRNDRTVLRGGAGLFYGRTTLVIPAFPDLPARTETVFTPDGAVASQLAFENRFGGALRNSRSLGWNLQIDHELVTNFFLRIGYQQRRTDANYVVERELGAANPLPGASANYFTLANIGLDNYREWQFTARYLLPNSSHLTASYVHASSVGDLNDLGSIYGPTPAEIIRPNERSLLAADTPHRFIVWAEVGLPLGLRAIPLVEVRSGFPYSVVNEFREYAGPANRAGRFPGYKSLDMQVTRVFTFKVRGKQRRIRVGLRLFNLFNTFNPQDVQNNLASPNYGTFYRGVKRRVRILFGFGN